MVFQMTYYANWMATNNYNKLTNQQTNGDTCINVDSCSIFGFYTYIKIRYIFYHELKTKLTIIVLQNFILFFPIELQ